jgi:phosphohistidine phosphatase SixA
MQRVVVMRHGDRLDHAEPIWPANKPSPWDPPLTDAGLLRAWTVGKRIRASAAAAGWAVHRVFVSPFLRCRQTAERAVAALCAAPDAAAAAAAIEDAATSVPLDTSRLKVGLFLCVPSISLNWSGCLGYLLHSESESEPDSSRCPLSTDCPR